MKQSGSQTVGDLKWPGYWPRLWQNTWGLAVGDAASIVFALFVGKGLQFLFTGTPFSIQYSLLLVPAWWMIAAAARLYPGWGVTGVDELRRIETLLAVLFGIVAAYLFVSGWGLTANRANYFIAFVICVIALPVVRHLTRAALVRRGRWGVPCVIYGRRDSISGLHRTMIEDPTMGFLPVGYFDDAPAGHPPMDDLPRLGDWHDSTPAVSVAVLGLQTMGFNRMGGMLDGPLSHYRTVLVAPELPDAPSVWIRPLDSRGVLVLEVRNNLLDPLAATTKRALNLTLTALLIPLVLPVLLIAMALIWLGDFHSPVYVQTRIGRGGRPFGALKLRTMRPDAEAELNAMMESDAAVREEWETTFKLKRDPRITRVGTVLRRWSIDELPQLWNVLVGDMALVGPRPLPRYHHDKLSPGVRHLRERVHPGITGLWQIFGRSDLQGGDLEKWDSYYVRNWSVWLDLLTLAQTVKAVIAGKGAY